MAPATLSGFGKGRIIWGKTAHSGVQETTIDDRVEALRTALSWQNAGFRRVKISADGRNYCLNDFAGTIMIGTKAELDQTQGQLPMIPFIPIDEVLY